MASVSHKERVLQATPANQACTGRRGFAAIFEHFSLTLPPGQAGFGFFLPQSVANANR
ncbi:MAG: hypothetical protein HPY76_03910 [Anaerolineae bacterium]|nr:hypothetical protein [Anaerolineae bacterium]